MNRVYLPLLPLPVLAVLVAVSACSKPRGEDALRIIPPAEKLLVAPAEARPPPPAPATPAALASAPPAEERPTAEDLKEFHRPVSK